MTLFEIEHNCKERIGNSRIIRINKIWYIQKDDIKIEITYCPFCKYVLYKLKSPKEKQALWKEQENKKFELSAMTDRY